MLPFLTLAFILGLGLGSLIPYYPLSITVLLSVTALGFGSLDVCRRIAATAASPWFGCLLCGVMYWFLAVEGSSKFAFHEPETEVFQSCSGRVTAPVQYSPGRMMIVVGCDGHGDR